MGTWRGAALIAATVVVAACAGGQPVPTPSTGTSPSPSAGAAALKPALGGLLDRSGAPDPSLVPVLGGFVVNVHWADLQPSAGGPIASNNAIDQAITTLRSLDPSGRMGLRVRMFAGIYAPDWAKSIGGPPITVTDPTTGQSGDVGRFWSGAFGEAYSDLETKLAARYDGVPEIKDITMSRCTTVFAEPFIRDLAEPTTQRGLLSAGFSVAADQACLREEVNAQQVWVHTRSDLAFNPYQVVGGSGPSDEAFTDQMMDYCRSTLGGRCVLANNSLRTPLQFPDMYAHIKALGPPITFQTAVLLKVGDLRATLETAIELGAGSVELPAGFQNVLSTSELASYNARLASNAAAPGP